MPKPNERNASESELGEMLLALKRQDAQGDAEALQELGDMYVSGHRDADGTVLVRQNKKRAQQLLVASAEAGDAGGCLSLGNLLSEQGDRAGARRWYRRALSLGLVGLAASNLAATELEVRRYSRALWWFERSREAGDGDAAVDCAYMKYYGIGARSPAPTAVRGLAKLDYHATTPFSYEEAHYLEAVAKIDCQQRLDRSKVEALLVYASRDGDYPEAAALLQDLRRGAPPIVRCRCRRGRSPLWAPCSPCALHRKSR
jgi:TPR repeat protein